MKTRIFLFTAILALVGATQAHAAERPFHRVPIQRGLAPAEVDGFQPHAGAPGTRVEIRGHGFQPGDRITLNGQTVPMRTISPRRIVVTIPAHATTGHLMLVRAGHTIERTSKPFTVLAPAPFIVSVAPEAGAPGEEIMIQGHGFGPEVQVFIGPHQATIERWSERQLIVRVPDAIRSGRQVVRVRNHHRETRATERFHVLRPAVILGLSRGRVWAGSTVVVNGRDLHGDMRVHWGAYTLPIIDVDRRGRSLTVAIPHHVAGVHPIHVDDGSVRIESPHVLAIEPGPACQGHTLDGSMHHGHTHHGPMHRRDHRMMD